MPLCKNLPFPGILDKKSLPELKSNLITLSSSLSFELFYFVLNSGQLSVSLNASC